MESSSISSKLQALSSVSWETLALVDKYIQLVQIPKPSGAACDGLYVQHRYDANGENDVVVLAKGLKSLSHVIKTLAESSSRLTIAVRSKPVGKPECATAVLEAAYGVVVTTGKHFVELNFQALSKDHSLFQLVNNARTQQEKAARQLHKGSETEDDDHKEMAEEYDMMEYSSIDPQRPQREVEQRSFTAMQPLETLRACEYLLENMLINSIPSSTIEITRGMNDSNSDPTSPSPAPMPNCTSMSLLESLPAVYHKIMNGMEESAQARKESFFDWLSPIDDTVMRNRLARTVAPSSLEWLSNKSEYKLWRKAMARKEKHNVLWVHGGPGTGKTMLSSSIADIIQMEDTDIETRGATHVAYISFPEDEKRHPNPASTYARVIRQLLSSMKDRPKALASLYQLFWDKRRLPSEEMLKTMLTAICAIRSPVIVLDGMESFDEGSPLRTTIETLLGQGVSILVTSEVYPFDFHRGMHHYLNFTLYPSEESVECALRQRMTTLGQQTATSSFWSEVGRAKHNSYYTAFLVAQASWLYKKYRPEGEVVLPSHCQQDMFHVTKVIMSAIASHMEPQNSRLAMYALVWITHSHRQLTVTELVQALHVFPGQAAIECNNAWDFSTLLQNSSLGLAEIEKPTQKVRLFHKDCASAILQHLKESLYLPSGKSAHMSIAKACLKLLQSYATSSTASIPYFAPVQKYHVHGATPLLRYAACHLAYHIQRSNSELLRNEMLQSLLSSSHLPVAWARLAMVVSSDLHSIVSSESLLKGNCFAPTRVNAVHIAAWFRLPNLLEDLLEMGAMSSEVNDSLSFTEPGLTPLRIAVQQRDEASVAILLKHPNIDPNTCDRERRTPLSCALEAGDEAMMRLLLASDKVDSNVRFYHYRPYSPFHDYGNNKGTMVHTNDRMMEPAMGRDDEYKATDTLLTRAVFTNSAQLTALLLSRKDLDVNVPDQCGNTALIIAVRLRWVDQVRMLAERDDVDVNARDCVNAGSGAGNTALWYALTRKGLSITGKNDGREGDQVEGRDEAQIELDRKTIVNMLKKRWPEAKY